MDERHIFFLVDAVNIGLCVFIVSLGVDMNRFQVFGLAIIFACFLTLSKMLIQLEKQIMGKKFNKLASKQKDHDEKEFLV